MIAAAGLAVMVIGIMILITEINSRSGRRRR